MKIINPAYASPELRRQIRAELAKADFPSVMLANFLQPLKAYEDIKEKVQRSYYRQEKDFTSHSYGKAPLPAALQMLLQSKELFSFLSAAFGELVGGEKEISSAALYRLGWKDYHMLPAEPEGPGMDLILDFTAEWPEDAGGLLVYRNLQGDFITFPARENALILVRRTPEVQRYIQYVNHRAENCKRLLMIGQIREPSC